jgi:hypothetical protein
MRVPGTKYCPSCGQDVPLDATLEGAYLMMSCTNCGLGLGLKVANSEEIHLFQSGTPPGPRTARRRVRACTGRVAETVDPRRRSGRAPRARRSAGGGSGRFAQPRGLGRDVRLGRERPEHAGDAGRSGDGAAREPERIRGRPRRAEPRWPGAADAVRLPRRRLDVFATGRPRPPDLPQSGKRGHRERRRPGLPRRVHPGLARRAQAGARHPRRADARSRRPRGSRSRCGPSRRVSASSAPPSCSSPPSSATSPSSRSSPTSETPSTSARPKAATCSSSGSASSPYSSDWLARGSDRMNRRARTLQVEWNQYTLTEEGEQCP